MNNDDLIAAYRAAGQGQVFAFWESLGAAERNELAAQAAEIDLAEIEQLNRTLVLKSAGAAGVNLDGLSPAPCERLPGNGGDAAKWAAAPRRLARRRCAPGASRPSRWRAGRGRGSATTGRRGPLP